MQDFQYLHGDVCGVNEKEKSSMKTGKYIQYSSDFHTFV